MATKEKKRVEPSKVKKGDIMAFLYWTRVNRSISAGDQLDVSDVDRAGPVGNFLVKGIPLVESAFSADQYHTTKRTTKTKIAEMLVSAHNTPFSVCFEKSNGSERVLRGRLIKPEPLLGRSMVDDLDLPVGEHRLRQVDHRTIRWLILNGVKYTVRK